MNGMPLQLQSSLPPLPIAAAVAAATASDPPVLRLNPAFDSCYALERATMRRPTQQRPIRSFHSVFCSKSATLSLSLSPSRLSFPQSPSLPPIKPSLETLQTRRGSGGSLPLPLPHISFSPLSLSHCLCILSVSFFPSRARCPSSFSPLGTIIIIG